MGFTFLRVRQCLKFSKMDHFILGYDDNATYRHLGLVSHALHKSSTNAERMESVVELCCCWPIRGEMSKSCSLQLCSPPAEFSKLIPQAECWDRAAEIVKLRGIGSHFSENACEKASFAFLRQELPVRLANIMKEINLLPDNLLRTPSVGLVQSWYMQSFQEILEFKDKKADDEKVTCDFTDAVIKVRNRHDDVIPTMAQGVLEYKETYGTDPVVSQNVQHFLDRFYMSRISIRMLLNQHTLPFGGKVKVKPAHPKQISSINQHCCVSEAIKDAYENARNLCDSFNECCDICTQRTPRMQHLLVTRISSFITSTPLTSTLLR
ncbi:pyruvate dehydrogenase (acetyl-transferring) kinase isozyme 1, mitochondrial-like [Nothobranchius furzeri]|uniref:pyruvate dehydrogenase (acetyl-transferring) kinase isozyme 1, mitochondrial-like n=1 Tax=Nothobranchius furzeri TaxID=105023 RepID=UPI0039047FB5